MKVFLRLLAVRGRRALRYFSTDGWPTGQAEPKPAGSVLIGQHYGFASEMPDDGQCLAVGVGGGSTSMVSVAEFFTGAPTLENGEACLWSKFGHKLLLKQNGDIVVMPGPGGRTLLGVETGGDPVVTESRIADLVTALIGHKHPETGATTLVSAELATVSVSGSPDVRAK